MFVEERSLFLFLLSSIKFLHVAPPCVSERVNGRTNLLIAEIFAERDEALCVLVLFFGTTDRYRFRKSTASCAQSCRYVKD